MVSLTDTMIELLYYLKLVVMSDGVLFTGEFLRVKTE
jgi:hypothetical protein